MEISGLKEVLPEMPSIREVLAGLSYEERFELARDALLKVEECQNIIDILYDLNAQSGIDD